MLSKWKNLLLSIMLVAVLAIPMGLVGADNEESSIVSEDVNFSGTIESNSDLITVERLDGFDMDAVFGDIDVTSIEDAPFEYRASNMKTDLQEIAPNMIPEGVTRAIDPSLLRKASGTRASDAEGEQDYPDYPNGSIINPSGETISGTLAWHNVQTSQDWIDWYKIGLSTEATNGGGSPVTNVSLTLNEYYSDDGDLYEFALDFSDPNAVTMVDDYGDILQVYMAYRDDMFGEGVFGGWDWWFDDGDDTDGWTPAENWSAHSWSARHSFGPADSDGYMGGLDEEGWMYIGISFNYFISSSAPATRPAVTMSYEFTVDTSDTQTRDPVANHWKNATTITNLGVMNSNNYMPSIYNDMDWWKFSGSDNSKLWNMSIEINRTSSIWLSAPTTQDFWDNQLEILIIWKNNGTDGIWDTADDAFSGSYAIMSYIWTGGGYIGDTLNAWMRNTFLESPDRTLWIGLQQTPLHGAVQNGQIAGVYYFPDHWIYSTYDITVNVGEVEPNVPPTISEVTVTSDFEQDTSGGYYESEFILEVTYQDDNDDPPGELWVYIDKGTPYEKASDISEKPKDVFDLSYDDGKVYKLEMLGEDLTDDPPVHTIDVIAIDDVPAASIRSPKWSELYNFEDGITVWDDEPVELNQNWQGFDELMEDDPTTYFPLEGIDGRFKDPENDFQVFYIWNETSEEWSDNFDVPGEDEDDMGLAYIEVLEYEGIWQVAITPKYNQHGSVSIRLQGEDEHSWINITTSIVIRPLNDPPMIKYIEIMGDHEDKGMQFEVDNIDPLRPVIHLEDEVTILEDEEFSFLLFAEDTDNEDEWESLEYSYVRSTSSDWDEDPDVGYNTGEVTFTPTNNDVRAGNDKMVFSVDDHGEDGDIKLDIYLEITNVNDPPTIMIPTTTPRTWKQFSKLSIRPIASDEDKNDQITFSVNFMDAIGDDTDSLEDQLPFMDVTKGIDWDITPTTGDFWFELDDQNIWKTSSGMVKSQEITIVFMATDKDGGEAMASINLVLNDENEEPPKPEKINFAPLTPKAKDPVNLFVDPVEDPDGDRLTYKWDFGDGSTGEGVNVNHTYATKGYKTVQMWVEDGQFATEKLSIRIEVLPEDEVGDDDTQPDDDDDVTPVGDETDNTMIIIVAAIIIVVVVLVVILFIFLLLRKKPAPAAQMYPGYDQQALGAYGQQGLPPGAVGELPPGAAPELPPAQDGQYPSEQLPPADGQIPMEPQPEVAPIAPATETVAPVAAPAIPEPQPEQPAGNACPSCNSAVDPTWFLCPNCKSPLQ